MRVVVNDGGDGGLKGCLDSWFVKPRTLKTLLLSVLNEVGVCVFLRMRGMGRNDLIVTIRRMKLGGLNSMLVIEHSPSIPILSKALIIIIDMDISHGSFGESDVSSITAATEAVATMLSTRNDTNRRLTERTCSMNNTTTRRNIGSPYGEDIDDDEFMKKKNDNMLKRIGVLCKKPHNNEV
nr:hypothetical protein [Tanacetum cinerariifolium]